MTFSLRRRRLCLFLAIIGFEASQVVSYKRSALRSSSSSSSSSASSANPQRSESTRASESAASASAEWERIHVIRRVYGEDNRAVRAEMRRIEERIPRYQTGIPGDLNHVVPYENHPYERSRWRRKLQESNSTASTGTDNATSTGDGGDTASTNATTTDGSSGARFQPMRIKYFTEALDAIRDDTNAAKIDWYINTILPKTAEFWSQVLSVVPVSGNLKLSSSELDSRMYCGDSEFTEVPTEHISDGVPGADLILYVSASESTSFCPDRTLAVAVPCNFDQFDRPVAGAVNVCLDNIVLKDDGSGTAADSVVQDYLDVTIHEVGHVLGHSSNSYRFYWDPDTGEPRTPRPFEAQTVTCVNNVERTIIVPAENTLQFVEANGQRYAAIVTDKVKAVARNQFDCQSLAGAFLENEPTREDSCIGDHWDERLFYPEAMSPVISPTTNIFSALTLALMEDSGWYRSNYSVTTMNPWGLGVGCDFVNKPCLLPESGANPQIPEYGRGFFCNSESSKGCSNEITHKMACTVIDYQYYVPQTSPPEQFAYFLDAPTMGGPQQADYCPVFGSPYSSESTDQLDCRNPDNAEQFLNAYEEKFGDDSQCIETTSADGLCFRTACVKDIMALRIQVVGEWHTCESDFQEIDVRLGEGLLAVTLVCPRLSQACPNLFCPFNCAGRGVCNYNATDGNGTARPKCECFDTSDSSLGCSDSAVPDGGFLDDSSGLFDNIEENFFDPLIAVFVDDPDTWTTATWAWAGGLIAIFVILLLCICSSLCPGPTKKSASY